MKITHRSLIVGSPQPDFLSLSLGSLKCHSLIKVTLGMNWHRSNGFKCKLRHLPSSILVKCMRLRSPSCCQTPPLPLTHKYLPATNPHPRAHRRQRVYSTLDIITQSHNNNSREVIPQSSCSSRCQSGALLYKLSVAQFSRHGQRERIVVAALV